MYLSKFQITTLKETPSDAEITSHQLMLRAGLIRKLASGLYTWLPLGPGSYTPLTLPTLCSAEISVTAASLIKK